MRAKEFTKEAAIDQAIDKAQQPTPPGKIKQAWDRATAPLPGPSAPNAYTQSKVGSLTARAVDGATNLAGKGVTGLGSALRAGFGKSMAHGYSFGAGPGSAAATQGIPVQSGTINPQVADYLKKVANDQPVGPTGNKDFDELLKNAGLLKQ